MPAVSYRVNTDVFATITQALSLLKVQDGFLCPDLLPLDKMPTGLDNVKKEIDSVANSLNTLNLLRDAMSEVLGPVRIAAEALQHRFDTLGRFKGVCSLPTELLSHIFQLSACKIVVTRRHEFVLGLSHVSRRFRAIALDEPRLWCTITNVQTPEEIEASLFRSKAVKLSIHVLGRGYMDEWRQRSSFEQVIMTAYPHRRRWGHLRCEFSQWDIRKAQEILTLYPSLTLPSLERLELSLPNCQDDYDRWNETRLELQAAFSGWHFPSLEYFDTKNIIIPLSSGGRLRTCALRMDILLGVVTDLPTALTVLEHNRRIEDLTLQISGFRGGDNNEYSVLTLPRVTKLTLIDGESESLRVIPPIAFIRSLHMPNLTELDLNLGICYRAQLWLQSLPFFSPRTESFECSHVRKLHIQARETVNAQKLFNCLENLNNLQEMSLDVTRLEFDDFEHMPKMPALKSLKMRFIQVDISEKFAHLLRAEWYRVWRKNSFQFTLSGQVHHRVKTNPTVVNRLRDHLQDNFHYIEQ